MAENESSKKSFWAEQSNVTNIGQVNTALSGAKVNMNLF